MSTKRRGSGAGGGCAGCEHAEIRSEGASRREFLRGAAAALAGLVAVSGMAPADLAGLPIGWAVGRRGGTGTLSYPLPSGDGVTIDKDNELILVRWEGQLYAFALSCPHQRTMLKWREKDALFQCTKHKSKYLPDGTFVSGRATRGMDRYPLRVSGGSVTVDSSNAILQDQDEAAWNAASASLI